MNGIMISTVRDMRKMKGDTSMTYLEENKKLIELFRPCRVTDVRDGMD